MRTDGVQVLPKYLTQEQAAAMPAQILRLHVKIGETQTTKRRNLGRVLRLILVCVLAVVALAAVLFGLYYHTVLSYAELEVESIQQNSADPLQVEYTFKVLTPGKLCFIRHSGPNHSRKFDWFPQRAHMSATWRWHSDPASGIEFTIRGRRGYLPVKERKEFPPWASTGGM